MSPAKLAVAMPSAGHPSVRARMDVGRINAKYSEVGSCNTVHILCMPVTCTYDRQDLSGLYHYGSPQYIKGYDCVSCVLSTTSLMTQSKQRPFDPLNDVCKMALRMACLNGP